MKISLNNQVTRFLVQEYVNKICYYTSEEELNYNVHKLIHTFSVVDMAQDLIKNTKPALPKSVKQHIINATVLHDIGRCHEFKKGKKINIDHGKVGADLIKKHFPHMKMEIQSTFFHNKLPSDKDPKFCKLVLDYVRDADMLANIQYEIAHTDIWIKHIVSSFSSKQLSPKIDQEVISALKQKRPVILKNIQIANLLTLWLWQLSWYYNLRTKAAFTIVHKKKLFSKFCDVIYQKIIPLTTKNKKEQQKLIHKIQDIFLDNLI